MSVRLILVRHAKSSWSDDSLADFDRPLNARGAQAAPAMGRWMVERGHGAEIALVSGARRTVETWEGIAAQLPDAPGMETDRRLYLASAPQILTVLDARTEPSVLIIAHNPGMADLAQWLAGDPPAHKGFARFPTGATLVLDLPAWRNVEAGAGRCIDFAVPRELT